MVQALCHNQNGNRTNPLAPDYGPPKQFLQRSCVGPRTQLSFWLRCFVLHLHFSSPPPTPLLHSANWLGSTLSHSLRTKWLLSFPPWTAPSFARHPFPQSGRALKFLEPKHWQTTLAPILKSNFVSMSTWQETCSTLRAPKKRVAKFFRNSRYLKYERKPAVSHQLHKLLYRSLLAGRMLKELNRCAKCLKSKPNQEFIARNISHRKHKVWKC